MYLRIDAESTHPREVDDDEEEADFENRVHVHTVNDQEAENCIHEVR